MLDPPVALIERPRRLDFGRASAGLIIRFETGLHSVRPGPAGDLRTIGAVVVRVAEVVDDRVLHRLFQMRGLRT